jgi:deferrochelatase/peroxidase EfeB
MVEPDLTQGETIMIATSNIDFADVQGIIRFGHGHLEEASFLLLRISDAHAARAWLRTAPVTTAQTTDSPPARAMQVAFTRHGLEALDTPTSIIAQFSEEFISGMAADRNRSQRLGDVGANAPTKWDWGGSDDRIPHLLVMLYAHTGQLEIWAEEIKSPPWNEAFEIQACLTTSFLDETEPFGFVDGVSQPELDWGQTLVGGAKDRLQFSNVLALGEVVLGYTNEYDLLTERPVLNPAASPQAIVLPPAEDVRDRRDLGRNGTYLVVRQLEQDVHGFWRYLDQQAQGLPERRTNLAQAMVGRTMDGMPLVPLCPEAIPGVGPKPHDIAKNQFTYTGDPNGTRCPLGAHIRRANPRTADMPGGLQGGASRLLRMLGFKRPSLRNDLVASTRFHRLLRRGRKYGSTLSPDDAVRHRDIDEPRGIHFICLMGNISRQFEFVQNAWMQSAKFDGLSDENDPLLGSREPLLNGHAIDRFTMPQEDRPSLHMTCLPQFVTVRGGAYFFLPGIRALRYIAGAADVLTPVVVPEPPPAGGDPPKLMLAAHRALQAGLRIERRLEPFFRPAFNGMFRESLARMLQYFVNRKRPNEGLKLAEERIYPDEQESLASITADFAGYMRRTYPLGGYERGGNTKTHGIVRAEVIIHEGLPAHLRHGLFAVPRTFPAYVRFSGPGPNLPPDIEDVGFSSMTIKVMDVPGPKLMDDERCTQDLLAVSTPSFVTPNTRENRKLQYWSFRSLPVFYFLNPFDPHLLDFFMQALWNETMYNPLATRYWSCVPYLLGEGQAMMYSFAPKSKVITDIPGVPFGRVPPHYLHDNLAATLVQQDAEFDLLVQVQTDPHLMPIENASVRWPEKLSPFIPVGTIYIPTQNIDTPAHVLLGKTLSLNPWHCLHEHRPLGNQNRARQRMYWELSRLRQARNRTPHIEPTGRELDGDSVASSQRVQT